MSSAIRVDDIIYGRVKHIPLKRTQPGKFGFLREADFEKFGKELAELHNDRAKRSVEDTVRQTNRSMIEEFELKGDNHSVAFLHWAGKKSSVGCFVRIFVYDEPSIFFLVTKTIVRKQNIYQLLIFPNLVPALKKRENEIVR